MVVDNRKWQLEKLQSTDKRAIRLQNVQIIAADPSLYFYKLTDNLLSTS